MVARYENEVLSIARKDVGEFVADATGYPSDERGLFVIHAMGLLLWVM